MRLTYSEVVALPDRTPLYKVDAFRKPYKGIVNPFYEAVFLRVVKYTDRWGRATICHETDSLPVIESIFDNEGALYLDFEEALSAFADLVRKEDWVVKQHEKEKL